MLLVGKSMGKAYLNKNVKFQCQNGNAVWFNAQNGDMKVKIVSAETIMDDCKLSIIGGVRPGQCNLVLTPNGTPGPCSAPIVSGSWNNDSRFKVGGKGVLTSGCSINCPIGGCIKPFKPTLMGITVDDAAKMQSVNISLENSSNSSPSEEKANSSTEKEKTSEKFTAITENTVREEKTSEEESNEALNVEYALCDYKNCEKARECEYLKALNTLKETNESKNAAELKINMGKDAFDLYAGECGDIATSLFGSYMYSIAHHHIIPANQCFKPFPEIVKLANYYGYNINKAENGISLPTMNLGYDKQPFDLRKEISFTAMDKLGKQWHKGGHKYSCKISADIDSVLPRPFLHYKDAVDKELTSFSMMLNEELKCRADNYDQQAAEFTKIMDRICERVAKKLRRFEDNPRKSYPCYISKLAFYFAFQEELVGYENELFGKEG